jgi:hypothetical protein
MPRFHFHKYLNGQLLQDVRGRRYPDEDAACRQALNQAAAFSSKANNYPDETHFGIEVTNGERTACSIRVSLTIKREDRQPEANS